MNLFENLLKKKKRTLGHKDILEGLPFSSCMPTASSFWSELRCCGLAVLLRGCRLWYYLGQFWPGQTKFANELKAQTTTPKKRKWNQEKYMLNFEAAKFSAMETITALLRREPVKIRRVDVVLVWFSFFRYPIWPEKLNKRNQGLLKIRLPRLPVLFENPNTFVKPCCLRSIWICNPALGFVTYDDNDNGKKKIPPKVERPRFCKMNQ